MVLLHCIVPQCCGDQYVGLAVASALKAEWACGCSVDWLLLWRCAVLQHAVVPCCNMLSCVASCVRLQLEADGRAALDALQHELDSVASAHERATAELQRTLEQSRDVAA